MKTHIVSGSNEDYRAYLSQHRIPADSADRVTDASRFKGVRNAEVVVLEGGLEHTELLTQLRAMSNVSITYYPQWLGSQIEPAVLVVTDRDSNVTRVEEIVVKERSRRGGKTTKAKEAAATQRDEPPAESDTDDLKKEPDIEPPTGEPDDILA